MKRKFFCYALRDFCECDILCADCSVYDGTGGECRDTDLTNADRIRLMTDDELAEAIFKHEELLGFCGNRRECAELLDAGETVPDAWCLECAKEWLKKLYVKEGDKK